MLNRLTIISDYIGSIKNVSIASPFIQKEEAILGKISVSEQKQSLDFEVVIQPEYPFQAHESETIRFINENLLSYNHVNSDGSICLHTAHCPELLQKLELDFEGLRSWIKKYYVDLEDDSNYEHIIVNESLVDNERHSFLFTDVDHKFSRGEFGSFQYSLLAKGKSGDFTVNTYLVQNFKKDVFCRWNSFYKSYPSNSIGLFVYIERPPVVNRRFIIKKWIDLEPYINQDFLSFLYGIEKTTRGKEKTYRFPLLIGYKLPTGEIHWQCAMFSSENFPNYGVKNPVNKRYEGRLKDIEILWTQTKNSSYKYFFGRGSLNEKLTNGKILIIGIGAIGSMVATTLVRGGCKNINIIDYDIKEPENICRSEYLFCTGINNKTHDLVSHLSYISPFVEVSASEKLTDYIKVLLDQDGFPEAVDNHLDQYDFIIDCSTDNDLAYILDNAKIRSTVINISITNFANELVCTTKPGLYHWLKEIFSKLEKNESLYNPTGCWNPTFSASYNDIAALVQLAIKYINSSLGKNKPVRNFYISQNKDNYTLKINQY